MKKEKKKSCNLEKKIIDKIGNNKTLEFTFNNDIYLDSNYFIFAFYTYKKEVCLLDNKGMDVDFSSLSKKNKTIIYKEILKDNYTQ